MPSQFIFWPITLPEENPISPKQEANISVVHPPPPPPPKARPRKSAKHAAPKRPPQRGLGIAQLERLRMEQAGETELLMHSQPPHRVVLTHMFVGSYPPQAGTGGGALPGAYPVPVGSMGPQGYMLRYLAPPAPEPPSTQMVPRPLMSPPVDTVPCYSDHCEFCVCKRRLFGESPVYENMDSTIHLDMDLKATMTASADLDGGFMASIDKVSMVERQTREYQFFPTCGGSLAEVAFHTMDDASMSAPLTSPFPSQPIDLSLKL